MASGVGQERAQARAPYEGVVTAGGGGPQSTGPTERHGRQAAAEDQDLQETSRRSGIHSRLIIAII